MRWLLLITKWGSRQSAAFRWIGAIALYGIALGARLLLGKIYIGVPALTFYPVIIIVSVLFGWKEALAVLILSVISGLYLFFPPGMYLLPVGWLFVGGLTIAVITALKTLTQELADTNEKLRIIFKELQHRVANTLQSVASTLYVVHKKVDHAPEEAKSILNEGMRRVKASANIHRRIHDPTLFEQGLDSILRDAVMTVVDGHSTNVSFDIEDVRLSFDQMSIITMIVIEFANNAQKHVFQRHLGSQLLISLKALPDSRAVLSVKDDGPGPSQNKTDNSEGGLGYTILRGLASQIGGNFNEKREGGMEISIIFPTPQKRQDEIHKYTVPD